MSYRPQNMASGMDHSPEVFQAYVYLRDIIPNAHMVASSLASKTLTMETDETDKALSDASKELEQQTGKRWNIIGVPLTGTWPLHLSIAGKAK